MKYLLKFIDHFLGLTWMLFIICIIILSSFTILFFQLIWNFQLRLNELLEDQIFNEAINELRWDFRITDILKWMWKGFNELLTIEN